MSQAQTNRWTTKEFEVIAGHPWEPNTDDENLDRMIFSIRELGRVLGWDPHIAVERLEVDSETGTKFIGLAASTKQEIEDYLKESATMLERWNFPEPNLHKVPGPNGQQAFGVYLTNFPADSWAAGLYDHICEGDYRAPEIKVIMLKAKSVIDDHGVKPFGYGVIAHELFHAVQDATDLFKRDRSSTGGRCWSVNRWISDGQADAVGWDLALALRRDKIKAFASELTLWGGRSYSESLVVVNNRRDNSALPAYWTSSFWRYLAELNHYRSQAIGRAGLPPPGPTRYPVNYKYLAALLATPAPGFGARAEVAWLDDALQQYENFKIDLRNIYPDFMAAFADYGAHRVSDNKGYEQGSNLWLNEDGDWIEKTFSQLAKSGKEISGCVNLVVRPDRRFDEAKTELRKIAARCFEIRPVYFQGDVSIEVLLITDTKEKLAQLAFGVAGERRTATPIIQAVKRDAGLAWTRFGFRLRGEETKRFVLTNVGQPAEGTQEQEVTISIIAPGHEHTAADWPRYGPDPPPGYRPPSGRRRAGTRQPDDDDSTRDRYERATQKVTVDGPATAQAKRMGDGGWVIHLNQVPDEVQMFSEVNADGGYLGQLFGMGEALYGEGGEDATYEEAMSGLVARGMAAERRDAAEIKIYLPSVDYGFAGPVDEATIEVSRYEQDPLLSLGPHDIDPSQIREFPPTGKVSIDKFTPEYMSGSFEGDLIDPWDVDNMTGDHPPTWLAYAPVVKSISGRFWIGSPWLNDDRIEITGAEHVIDDLETDLIKRMPAEASDVPGEMIDRSGIRSGGQDTPGDSSGSSTSNCDCTCAGMRRMEARQEAIDEAGRMPTAEEMAMIGCMFQCMPQWTECEE